MAQQKTQTESSGEVVDAEPVDRLPAVVKQETRDLSRMDDTERLAVVAFLESLGEMTEEDPEMAAMSIIGRVLRAQTIDDVLAESTVFGARSVLGVPLTLHAVRFRRSDYEGLGGYALLDVTTNDPPQEILVSCGGAQVMAQAYRLAQLDALPCDIVISETKKPTRGGFHPLYLRAVPRAEGN